MSEEKKEKIKPSARRKARRYALQALYQWQIVGSNLREIEQQFCHDHDMRKVDVPYFSELLHKVSAGADALDQLMFPYLDRALTALDPVELAILRMGTYELSQRPEIPYRVVINEALELAKTFGAEDGYKYVNGILDRLARDLRAVEMRG